LHTQISRPFSRHTNLSRLFLTRACHLRRHRDCSSLCCLFGRARGLRYNSRHSSFIFWFWWNRFRGAASDSKKNEKGPVHLKGRYRHSLRSRLWITLVAFFIAVPLIGCGSRANHDDTNASKLARPTIVFMTDFGTANDAVAICRAVIVGIVPDVRIMDITHRVTPFSIEEGARFLAGVTPYYPLAPFFWS